jgi:hypothetical protein
MAGADTDLYRNLVPSIGLRQIIVEAMPTYKQIARTALLWRAKATNGAGYGESLVWVDSWLRYLVPAIGLDVTETLWRQCPPVNKSRGKPESGK